MKTCPLHKFSSYFPEFQERELLDFGIEETSLVETSKSFNDYLGVKKCFLKLETELPTGTMKDRITELMFSRFQKEKVFLYAQASTGNTAASLAWGMTKYEKEFKAHLFVGDGELPYHNFEKPENMKLHLLSGATYDEAVEFAKWFTFNVLKDERELGGASSSFRQNASKLSYLEALNQLKVRLEKIDLVCQSISAGVGIIGADKAIENAIHEKWIHSQPRIIVGQPKYANPIAACFNSGKTDYDHKFTINKPLPSIAWPIRRGNGATTYPVIKNILDKSNGLAFDVSEEEISEAKRALFGLEHIDASYASSVVMAGLHKRRKLKDLCSSKCLIMVTGKDRLRNYQTPIDKTWQEVEWRNAM